VEQEARRTGRQVQVLQVLQAEINAPPRVNVLQEEVIAR
jgi:hypothetical protein